MRHTCLHPCLDARWLWTCVLKCVRVSLLVSHALAMHFGFVVRVSVSYIVQSRGHVAHVACVEFLVSLWMVPLRSHRPQPLPPVTALDVATESSPPPFFMEMGWAFYGVRAKAIGMYSTLVPGHVVSTLRTISFSP